MKELPTEAKNIVEDAIAKIQLDQPTLDSINAHAQDSKDFELLMNNPAGAVNYAIEAARLRRYTAFQDMYKKLGDSYYFKKLFLKLTMDNTTNLIEPNVIEELGATLKTCNGLSEEAANQLLDEFVKHNQLFFPMDTLITHGRNALPIGKGLVEYDGRLYTVEYVKRNYDCSHYGHQIVLRDIETGKLKMVPHSINSQHVRYRTIYYDADNNIACDAYGKGGTFTWETGCKKLVAKGMYKDVAKCHEKIVEDEVYPKGHPKLALCQKLLEQRIVF